MLPRSPHQRAAEAGATSFPILTMDEPSNVELGLAPAISHRTLHVYVAGNKQDDEDEEEKPTAPISVVPVLAAAVVVSPAAEH